MVCVCVVEVSSVVSPSISSTDSLNPQLQQKFQSVLALGTRPDILYAVAKLATKAVNPSEEHLSKALYIMNYLAGTRECSLSYHGVNRLENAGHTPQSPGSPHLLDG